LARNVAFLSALMESGVEFVACDNPTASKLTLHILSAIAEHEAEAISVRTKAALSAAKARGQLLGSARPGHWKGREKARNAGLVKAREQASIANRAKALAGVADLLPEMFKRRQTGESLSQIASALNDAGQRTTRGNLWTPMGIKLAIDRAKAGQTAVTF
jgi:DNA invertase Pin-like site-specific DNA recombinase